jgi:hypothetical protein
LYGCGGGRGEGAGRRRTRERFVPLLRARRPDMLIAVLPGVDHIGIIVQPAAIAAGVAALESP